MGKWALVTPLYLSGAWTLLISYQLFTQTAVTTVLSYVNLLYPPVGVWLLSRIDMIVFMYAFAWVFILSSVIPSMMLGKSRGVLTQFFFSLTLTFLAIVIQDGLIATFNADKIDQIFRLSFLFDNPFIATIYLSIPYITMIIVDARSRRSIEKETADHE